MMEPLANLFESYRVLQQDGDMEISTPFSGVIGKNFVKIQLKFENDI